MKKIIFLAIVFSFCLVLSGCLDIFQYFSMDSTGKYYNVVTITVSKSLFEMGNKLSETNEPVDYDSLFEGNESFDEGQYKEFGATIKKINTESDVGVLIEMDIDYRNAEVLEKLKTNDTSFMPRYDVKNVIIHIGEGNASVLNAENEMVAVFLSAAKYRLLISKECIANISKVTLKLKAKETEISFLDLRDQYLIEIPLLVVLNAADIVIYSK